MSTRVHVSKKLNAIIPKELINKKPEVSEFRTLNKWNATLFYISHKKCLLLVNSSTFFAVILENIKKSDFNNITKLFIQKFYEQVMYEGIVTDRNTISKFIGEIDLYPTDNDRVTIGIQTSLITNIEYRKEPHIPFENWDIRYLNSLLNELPYSQLGWTIPSDNMKVELNKIKAK